MMPRTRDNLQLLASRGLFSNNMDEIVNELRRFQGAAPLAVYVLSCVLVDLSEWWRDRPVSYSERQLAEQRLLPNIERLLDAIVKEEQLAFDLDELTNLVTRLNGYFTELEANNLDSSESHTSIAR